MDQAEERWGQQMAAINTLERATRVFKPRQVWQCQLGINVGQEQNGNRRTFLRPVLVLQSFNTRLFWGVPLTTKVHPESQHYVVFTHGGVVYGALVTQLRTLDARRLTRNLYTLDAETFLTIQVRLARTMLRDEQNRTPAREGSSVAS